MRLKKSHVLSGALAVALLGATATAWYFAAQARTPAQRAEETEEPEDSVIAVRVEEGQLVDTMEFTAVLDRTGDFPVPAPAAPDGVEVALASKLPLEVGDEVNAGTVLLEVSGRPMIALPGDVPAYRDLVEGDSGPDVEQLQKALSWIYGTPVTGDFDSRTASDLEKLYGNLGYEVPTTAAPGGGEAENEGGFEGEEGEAHGQADTVERVRLPAAEAVFLPELPMQVGEVKAQQSAPVEGTVMTLVSGDWRLEAELGDDEAAELGKYGDDAELEYGPGPLEGAEVAVPELDVREVEGEVDEWTGESSGTVEKTFAVFEFDEESVEGEDELVPGVEQTVVLIRARSADDALIVPLSALWTDSNGKTMLTVLEGGDGAETHLEVEVTLRHEGRGVVVPVEGELSERDKVVVAWRDRAGR
jgi:multidrug efflux pump subunit AcrA (membrane-fusion protein)